MRLKKRITKPFTLSKMKRVSSSSKLSRIKDYEFLGLYRPSANADNFFYVYQMELEDGTNKKVFYSSLKENVPLKGDVVEYEESDTKMIIRIPQKKSIPFTGKKIDS